MAKKATYWLIGPTEVTLARHKNSFYYVFNKRTGDWIRTERAFDEIVRGMARQIPRTEARSRIDQLFPDNKISL